MNQNTENKKILSNKFNQVIVVLILVFILLIVVILFYAWPAYQNAAKFGSEVGTNIGGAVGTAVGSYKGITSGLEQGAEDGAEDAVVHPDVDEVISDIQHIARLDVMEAEDLLYQDFRQSNYYKALFVYKANATFYVDLDQAEFNLENNVLKITLPDVKVDFIIDDEDSEKLIEWQKFFWSGSEKHAYEAYLNSMSVIKKKSVEEMDNYNSLMKEAKVVAKDIVQELAESLIIDKNIKVSVQFKDEKNEQ